MKGGGRGKEPLVAGEVAGKRPKRKCLQWHPLLSKKALDFSEEEEEEDEEELDKVSVLETFHLVLYYFFFSDKSKMNTTMFCESAASSRCCVAQSRGCRCNVEAQRRRRRRTPTSKGPGVR